MDFVFVIEVAVEDALSRYPVFVAFVQAAVAVPITCLHAVAYPFVADLVREFFWNGGESVLADFGKTYGTVIPQEGESVVLQRLAAHVVRHIDSESVRVAAACDGQGVFGELTAVTCFT